MDRQEIIQRIKELVLTFQMLKANEIITIIKNSQDTTNITDYEIMQIIKNIKTSIGTLDSQPSLDIMSSVSKVIENYDQKNWTSSKTLGEGTFGVVKIQEYDGKKVAFKEIKNKSNITHDFISEVGSYAILTAIGSENTPKLVGFNISSSDPLGIAIELADTDLDNWIYDFPLYYEPGYEQGKEKQKQMLPVIVDKLLESLTEIQSVGIMHNDIKPQNMLLTLNPDGTVAKAVITDFGSASSFSKKGPNICTPHFRAPEVWKGGYTSFASDCWSFAMSIINLCSRIYYYNGEDPNKFTKPHLPTENMTGKMSTYLRPDQVDLINHMISWEPNDRCVKRTTIKYSDRNWAIPANTILTHRMFNILFEWMQQVKHKYVLQPHTLAVAIDIIFRFYNNLDPNLFDLDILQLSAVCALHIASLWGQEFPLDIGEYVYITAKAYSKEQIIKHTHEMLKVINGLLWVPGLDGAIKNLTGPTKEIQNKLETMADFNDLL
jgi:serine/threonine protein kinase